MTEGGSRQPAADADTAATAVLSGGVLAGKEGLYVQYILYITVLLGPSLRV